MLHCLRNQLKNKHNRVLFFFFILSPRHSVLTNKNIVTINFHQKPSITSIFSFFFCGWHVFFLHRTPLSEVYFEEIFFVLCLFFYSAIIIYYYFYYYYYYYFIFFPDWVLQTMPHKPVSKTILGKYIMYLYIKYILYIVYNIVHFLAHIITIIIMYKSLLLSPEFLLIFLNESAL